MPDSINFQPVFEYIDSKNRELWDKMDSRFANKDDFMRMEKILDNIVTTVHKLDEERLITVEWVRRVKEEVEKIKKHLQIA